LQDAQDLSDEVTTNGIEPTHNVEEDKFFGKKFQTHFDSKAKKVVKLRGENP